MSAAHGEDGQNHAVADAGAPKLSKMRHVTFGACSAPLRF